MGSDAYTESNPLQYAIRITDPKPGESGIYVRPDAVNGLVKRNYIGIDNEKVYLDLSIRRYKGIKED